MLIRHVVIFKNKHRVGNSIFDQLIKKTIFLINFDSISKHILHDYKKLLYI